MGIIITLLLVLSVGINVWLLRRKSRLREQSVRSTLLQGIRNVKELATIRQSFQSIVMYEDSRALLGFSIPGTTRKFILKYSGTLTCGCDLSGIKLSERFALNRIRMVVPNSQLLDLYADMGSIEVYDQKAGLFSKILLQDQNREITKNLEEVRQDTLKSDVLRRAEENVRTLLVSLAASMGMEAEIVFEGSETQTLIPEVSLEAIPEAPLSLEVLTLVEALPAGSEDN